MSSAAAAQQRQSGDGAPKRAAQEVANNPWGERAARTGIAARGVVFIVLGYLVARIATGALGGGGTKNAASGPGVADAILEQTGGHLALGLLGIGLALYALFCLLELFRAHSTETSDLKRWGGRARSLWQAALYTAFGVYCEVKTFSGSTSSGNSSHSNRQQEQWSARVLRWPAGWLWLALLGVVLFVMAGYQAYRCITRGFFDDLENGRITRRARQWIAPVGVVGHAGRGGAFALVGYFVLSAAIENDPQKGRGVDGSARMLANTGGGTVLLFLLAIGLAIFGVYQFVEARYRKV